MIRILLFIVVIYIILRLIKGPKNRKKPKFKFRYGNFPQDGFTNGQPKRKKRLEEIEEAEFEDITDSEQEKKENKA